MPPKAVTLAAFLPAQLKPTEQAPESTPVPNGQPRPQRCRCEGPFDLCWRYPAATANAACKPTWDRLLAPFQFKGREWTIVELRSLWPHTVQALNERLQKGRMERTLKDDLQDDLQVMVDLIQHSCKPHPRPPRAGMKTLIVQGRILAEAIAQDALFQLDPSDPSAPRPDRDLVDLINRLREHHPASLLAPALHVLRTLGNTAVHLDRDSARLTDGEIGDAAAVCCRFVVLVVDAYMQMCANLHKHEETEEALAQPLLEAPVAPIPAPNVLLRPREAAPATAASPAPPPPAPPPQGEVPAGGPAVTGPPATAHPPPVAAAAPPPPRSTAPPSAPPVLLLARPAGGSFRAAGADGGGVDDELVPSSGNARSGGSSGGASACSAAGAGSGGGGHRRSCGGSADGTTARVPYSLVSNDWTAAVQPHTHAAGPAGGGVGCGTVWGGGGGGSSPGDPHHQLGSRGWWPPAAAASTFGLPRADGDGQVPAMGPALPPAQLQPPALLPYGPPASNWAAGQAGPPSLATHDSSGARGGSSGGMSYPGPEGSLAPPPPLPQHLLQALGSAHSLGTHLTAPYAFTAAASAISAASGTASPPTRSTSAVSTAMSAAHLFPPATTTAAAAVGQTDPWVPQGSDPPAGGSPRRFPISLTNGDANGDCLLPVIRGGSPTAARRGQSTCSQPPSQPRPSAPQPQLHATLQPYQPLNQPQQQLPQEQQQHQQQLPGPGPGPAPGSVASAQPAMSAAEASKRLLQLCATAQAPPAAKVEALLRAGASLSFTDKSGMTALHMACYWSHAAAARRLLEVHPGAAAAADREGRTPLWVASQRGHGELVELLLGRGPGGDQVDVASATGVTPLRVAAAQGHTQVVAALLKAGANVDAADKDGYTPLYVAAARSQLEVVRLLLAAGPAVDRSDRAGRTPLWAALHPGGAAKAEACPERRAAVVRALLAAGADVYLLTDARDRDYCWQLLAQSIAAGE